MRKIFFVAALLVGLAIRLFFVNLATDELYFDAAIYSNTAIEVLRGKSAIDCCYRNPGYPLFIAGIYAVFGAGIIKAVQLVQVILDLLTAVLLYKSAKSLFGEKTAKWSYLLYLTNPFTSSFTGIILQEIVTFFLMAVTVFILTREKFARSPRLWFSFGVLSGLVLLTRMSLLGFTVCMIVFIALVYIKGIKKITYLIIVTTGFLLANSYSMLGNYKAFGVVSLVPPYTIGSATLYVNLYQNMYPELMRDIPGFDRTAWGISRQFDATPIEQKQTFVKYVTERFWLEMKTAWPRFVAHSYRNMVWLWDKRHLFVYQDPLYPKDIWPVRLLNISYIALFVAGMVRFRPIRTLFKVPLALYTMSLFFYITFAFSLVSNESRHTLVFYPLLFLWAGRGLEQILVKK